MHSFFEFLIKRDKSLCEVYLHKGRFQFDEEDLDYLSQFKPEDRLQALFFRYSKALPQAVIKTRHGAKIRPGWNDVGNVQINLPRARPVKITEEIDPEKFIDVWVSVYNSKGEMKDVAKRLKKDIKQVHAHYKKFTNLGIKLPKLYVDRFSIANNFKIYPNIKLYIPRLFKKLQDHGFDLSYWEPGDINYVTFKSNFSAWRKNNFETLYKPYPYKQMPRTNSYDNSEKIREQNKWKKIEDLARNVAFEKIQEFTKKMDDPYNSHHLNRWYWKRNFEEIVNLAVDYIKNNLKKINLKKDVKYQILDLMNRFLGSYVQKGDITRKIKKKIEDNVDKDLFPLLSKTWPKPDPKISGPAWTLGGEKGTERSALMNFASKITGTEIDPETGGLSSKMGPLKKIRRKNRS